MAEQAERTPIDWLTLPPNLPRPVDDGAARHLQGARVPSIPLESTSGRKVDLSRESRTVVFCYPRTGRPGEDLPGPDGSWDAIPGARGCTPQACAFRDAMGEFAAAGYTVFGLSTQSTDHQREAVERLHLPYELLSDTTFAFTDALKIPTFEHNGRRFVRRLTMVVEDGRIDHVFYPVFPPDKSPDQVLDWLRSRPAR
jgi:peroxiredoxin